MNIKYILLCVILLNCTVGNKSNYNKNDIDESIIEQKISELDNVVSYNSLDSPRYKITISKEQTYSLGKIKQFYSSDQIVVGSSDRIYIRRGVSIYVFNLNGNHISTMGREGRGPGEHNNTATNEMVIQPNYLFTYDEIQYRVNIFSLKTLKPVGGISMDPTKFKGLKGRNETFMVNTFLHVPFYYSFNDSLLLIRLNSTPINKLQDWSRSDFNKYRTHLIPSYYYIMNHKGEIVSERIFETSFKLKFMGRTVGGTPLQFDNRTIMEVDQQSQIYTANTQNLMIKIYNSQGTYKRAIYYPYSNAPFNREEYLKKFTEKKRVREVIQKSSLPDSWPALTDLLVDDEQRIWIATYTGDPDNYRWYVLNTNGKHLATFDWPANHYYTIPYTRSGIRSVKNGYMYAFHGIPDSGAASGKFVRYKIEFSPNNQGDSRNE